MFTDIKGRELKVGDRITPTAIDRGVPAFLASSKATIVGFGRTRIRVQFDMESYGGRWPEYRSIPTSVLKVEN